MRAWRLETLASGSSESKSTSGKTPPSASHRPMFDSWLLKANFLPADTPRSITSVACTLLGWNDGIDTGSGERCAPLVARLGEDWRALPFEPLPLPSRLALWPASQSGVPQTSQNRDVSGLCVLHLSQTIIRWRRRLVHLPIKHLIAKSQHAPTDFEICRRAGFPKESASSR